MNFKEFLGATTLYPYYFAYAAERSRANFIEKASGRSAPKGSIFSSWNFTLNKIKACPECISTDTEKFGEPYWHRCHQVDAVHICHSHGIPLLSARTQFFDSPHMLLEPLSHRTELRRYLPDLTEKARQRLTEVADEAEQLMREGLKGSLRQPIANSVGNTLQGVYPLRGVINMTDLEIDMVDFFGEQCMNILGLMITPGAKGNWVRMLLGNKGSPDTTKNLVFKIFYERIVLSRGTQNALRQRKYMPANEFALEKFFEVVAEKKWHCQNPLAYHFGMPTIDEVYKCRDFHSKGIISLRCECGYTFTANFENLNTQVQPKKIKVQHYGDHFVSELREIGHSGVSIKELSRMFRMSATTVRNMLKEEYSTQNRRHPKGPKTARKRVRLYEKSENLPIDYATRDEEYAARFFAAATRLKLQVPPVRVSKNKIAKAAGIRTTRLKVPHAHQLALNALDTHSESALEFRARVKSLEQ